MQPLVVYLTYIYPSVFHRGGTPLYKSVVTSCKSCIKRLPMRRRGSRKPRHSSNANLQPPVPNWDGRNCSAFGEVVWTADDLVFTKQRFRAIRATSSFHCCWCCLSLPVIRQSEILLTATLYPAPLIFPTSPKKWANTWPIHIVYILHILHILPGTQSTQSTQGAQGPGTFRAMAASSDHKRLELAPADPGP